MEEVKGCSLHCDPVLCAYRDGVEAELPGETPPSLQVLQVCTVGMLGCHAEQHCAAWVLGKGCCIQGCYPHILGGNIWKLKQES